MNYKYLIPLPLSVVIWSGYVLFDMFVYCGSNLHGILPVIGIVMFSICAIAIWKDWFIFNDEDEIQKQESK